MEQFVRYVVAGGLNLVAGLWLIAGTTAGTVGWLLGVALAVLGVSGLGAGIGREVTLDR